MHSLTVHRDVEHPAARVWDLVNEFSSTWVYHPIVEHSRSLNGRNAGLGAERECRMYDGACVRERVVEHDPAAMRYLVEVIDHGPFPLTFMDVAIQVHPLDAKRCRLTYEGRFTVKMGPLGWVMGKVVMERQFRKMLGQVIEGAGRHLDTGRVVQQGGGLGELRGAR